MIRKFVGALAGLLGGSRPGPEEAARLFRQRHASFNRLLEANNTVLELMSELEEAMGGSRVFGLSFVRSKAVAVSVNVYKIIQLLCDLAPGKAGAPSRHAALYERFQEIQQAIELLLKGHPRPEGGRLLLDLADIDVQASDQAGSKMANLGQLRNRLALPTPDGFVITAAAYDLFMRHNELPEQIRERLQLADEEGVEARYRLSSEIQQLILRGRVPEELTTELDAALRRLRERLPDAGNGELRLSVRSSALGEDSAGASFAGQFRSLLGVRPENVVEAYREVLASKYSLHAMTYRLAKGLRDADIAMCVGVLAMIRAETSGVMYSRNPVAPRDDAVFINAVWGLPKSVVDGSAPVDLFEVLRDGQVRRRSIQRKTLRYDLTPDEGSEGVAVAAVPEPLASTPCLDDAQAMELARLALRLEAAYGQPQDIEWALDAAGRIFLLQCRPLAARPFQSADAGTHAPEPLPGHHPIFCGGTTASPGAAAGVVHVARKDIDALTFPDGGVLVIEQALPRWASLINRAAAVVAAAGSITGHLANVAREFEVPALFDVGQALDALRPGTLVTVDAEGRCVYPGRVEQLLAGRVRATGIMHDSPINQTLQAVAGHILPLNLLDPEARSFSPAGCRSYHDITRYAHEMSVREMFELGSRPRFAAQAAKRLVAKVPMQWWVINLDDGFAREVPGKTVPLEDIASEPMLALWAGLTAVPWSGPPQASAKGVMSVFLESTMNPELGEAAPGFAQKNLFLVTRDYCCLNARFGFHFTTVEALLAKEPGESYVNFKFSGGAADDARRQRRAELIAEVLESKGFAARIKGDNLFARAESRCRRDILERLLVLGYLLLHTRQLDMAMADAGSVARLRDRFRQDIATLRLPPELAAGRPG